MPKRRRILSAILALWLCVMLVAFTYTWVSRNWTPSIKSDEINIASSGALVISILGDTSAVHTEVSLNDVVGYDTFTFKQVSSQDGINFFWKDYAPTLDGKAPAVFRKIGLIEGDVHTRDYIDTSFCLKLAGNPDEPEQSKYIFIHPQTMIKYVKDSINDKDLNEAIRISLTFEDDDGMMKTVILADFGDNVEEGVDAVNAGNGFNNDYRAVLPDAHLKNDAEGTDALGYQTVYDLQYFNCGRTSFNMDDLFCDENYSFDRNPDRALFKLNPGANKWIYMRIWLEGQDEENCVKEIAGKKFELVLKFDSAYVEPITNNN